METVLFYFVLINIFTILAGYVFVRKSMVWPSWLLLVLSVLIVHILFLNQPSVLRMFVLITTAFTGMKVVSATVGYQDKTNKLTFKQWLFFCLTWAGMKADIFESLGASPLPGGRQMIVFGTSRIGIGLLLVFGAHRVVLLPLNPDVSYVLTSLMLLVAFSLILHFGLLNISAGIWRFFGVNTYFLFNAPLKASSLTEFWSKRWNVAFSEMTSITIFRPLKDKLGSGPALIIAFLFSGLLHELAISVSVKNGYGLPMLYFIIHGCVVLIEKVLFRKNILFLQNKIFAKLWVLFWLVAPIPLLFHYKFMQEIVWPLAGLTLR
ncbi:wax synthase family protein [Dyadobacter psychrotolerans]|uniref:Wax synthase domain-containing protein n=1 Tax=Dyadobacter psychrotolerans TaxID=2541721 RepID=A0A4R5DL78_9BACT|nr:membrane bound O-acyl transferase family-domain-containing protein [Dyadobacter psychrotolerans]TDE12790.1 hypothetical protein E0F88_20805 [Dyadobacter psychrotolerans]